MQHDMLYLQEVALYGRRGRTVTGGDPERLLQMSYKNMHIVAVNELLQRMQNS